MTRNLPNPSAGRALPMPDLSPPPRSGLKQQQLTPNALSPSQKAALVIAALGPEAAGPIIERVDDKHLRSFARAYSHLQSVPKAALKIVVEEFVGSMTVEDNDIKGGVEETQELLRQFVSEDDITRLMDDINVPGGESVWDKLDRVTDEALAEYLSAQNPQLVAVVLSKINPEKASRVLDILDDEVAQQVIVRLARPMQINNEVLQVLADTIERDFLSPQRGTKKVRNPGEMIGSMMNNIMSEKREKLLAYIAEQVPDILTDVKKSLLTFQDLPERVPPNAVPMVVKEMDLDVFLQAARFGRQNAPSSVDFIFANISQRMRQQYEEQMEKLKAISVKESESAQSAFMTIVRKLASSGEIELIEIAEEPEKGDEDGAKEKTES